MAAVTKNLGFAITTSTSYEAPYVVARRFSTLDHLTNGRFGWNIVTSFKESAAKAVGLTTFSWLLPRLKLTDRYIIIRLVYLWWSTIVGTKLRTST